MPTPAEPAAKLSPFVRALFAVCDAMLVLTLVIHVYLWRTTNGAHHSGIMVCLTGIAVVGSVMWHLSMRRRPDR